MKKQDLRIVFLGNPDFAVESLRALVENGYNIVGVVTGEDKPAGRGHKLLQSAVKRYALSQRLNILQPAKLKDPEFIGQLHALNADLFIVIAFRMLPEVVWSMPSLGTFNLHASLLPKYRGAAPINWAVINGETQTGVTTFFLKHEIDTGDIIAQERIDILPSENVGDIHDKLMHLGAKLTLETVGQILNGNIKTISQSELLDGAEATPAPKIFRDTCHIDCHRSAIDIHNLVRGLSPHPCAWIELTTKSGSTITAKVYSTKISDRPAIPGKTIVSESGHIYINATDRLVEILELQPSGKNRMFAPDFLRGTSIATI